MTTTIQPTPGEKLVAAGTLAMATGAFFGHLLAPDAMARFFGWPQNRWYQREIGAFNAGLGYGVIELLRGRRETALLRSAAFTALLLAATRAAALASGDRSGRRNIGTVLGDLALGVGAVHIARRRGTRHKPDLRAAGANTELHLTADELRRGRTANAPAKLAHIVFRTPRLAEMISWYTAVLDARVVFSSKQIAFLTYDDEHHRIALVRLPALFKIPGIVWSKHRKFWGFDHAAFTYDTLDQLVATYRRVQRTGIDPVWCINHGPTTSLYYEDPDGNRIELQVDNFTTEQLLDWMGTGEFDRNPIGVEFDPDVLERKLHAGVPTAELVQRGSAPPDGREPRAGLRTLRWKTL